MTLQITYRGITATAKPLGAELLLARNYLLCIMITIRIVGTFGKM